jgi:uncharacterized protein
MKMKKRLLYFLVLATLLSLIIAGCSGAGEKNKTSVSEKTEEESQQSQQNEPNNTTDVQLPDKLTITSYDIGSGGYTELAAISDALTKKYGTQIRMMPSASGIGRILPLKNGTAQIGGRLGDEVYYAFEGIEEFATPQWGPQDTRYIFPILNHFGAFVLDDSKYHALGDLKGAKVGYVIGNPSYNLKVEGLLAGGGLTYDDVEVVEISSYGDQPTLMAQGIIDVSMMVADAAAIYEAEELHGIRWLDHSILQKDPEALKKLQEVYPFGIPNPWDLGGGLTKGQPEILMGYSTYAPAAYAQASPDLVYNFLKALEETHDMYKDATSNLFLWHYELAKPEPLGVPIHEGAVRYFKEKGMWTDEYDIKNNELIDRQQKLKEAWEVVIDEASKNGIKEKDFPEYWLKRKAELVD